MPRIDKQVLSWAVYDWANSAFATTVIAGFFPVFFKEYWSVGVDAVSSTARLGLVNSFVGIVVAVLAPILGAVADKGSAKKKFLFFFACMGMVMTGALYWVAQGAWLFAVMLYAMANIGFSCGNIFYDSLLPSVATEKHMDRVSALGYALGYLGGGLLFSLNVFMTLNPALFGFENAGYAVRFSFLTVGIWWALFSVPVLLFVPEDKNEHNLGIVHTIEAGLAQIKQTFAEIRQIKHIFVFLIAYWFYIDGVDTVVRMAVDYGLSIGFQSTDLILALLITQFVGFPSALFFGWLGGRIGTKNGIYLGIVVYILVSFWGAFIQAPREFYYLAVIIGLVQGGVQALSRSLYARMIPADKSAEFFGFYNMLGKFAVVIGPVLMSATGLIMQKMGMTDDTASRMSIASLSLLFIIGGLLLTQVREKEVFGRHIDGIE